MPRTQLCSLAINPLQNHHHPSFLTLCKKSPSFKFSPYLIQQYQKQLMCCLDVDDLHGIFYDNTLTNIDMHNMHTCTIVLKTRHQLFSI